MRGTREWRQNREVCVYECLELGAALGFGLESQTYDQHIHTHIQVSTHSGQDCETDGN